VLRGFTRLGADRQRAGDFGSQGTADHDLVGIPFVGFDTLCLIQSVVLSLEAYG
jgi:hypothetical protein